MIRPPPDTPEQVDELHAAGWRRSVEIDGVGVWVDPAEPERTFHGGANAVARLRGQPPPFPYNHAYPWGP